MFVWGTSKMGELGLGKDVKQAPMPVLLPIPHKIKSFTLYTTHNIAITGTRYRNTFHLNTNIGFLLPDEGKVIMWGSSTDHQLGIGTRSVLVQPTLHEDQALAGEKALLAATGFGHTILLTEPAP